MRWWTLGAFLAVAWAGCGDSGEDEPAAILPSLNPINFQNYNPDPVFAPGSTCVDDPNGTWIDLILTNTGDLPLEITGLDVQGDVRCSLASPIFENGLSTASVAGHHNVFLRICYTPGGTRPAPVGIDQIALVIESNAANEPALAISICGCVVEGDLASAEPCECFLPDVPDGTCAE